MTDRVTLLVALALVISLELVRVAEAISGNHADQPLNIAFGAAMAALVSLLTVKHVNGNGK